MGIEVEVKDLRQEIAEYLCLQDGQDWEWLKSQPADDRCKGCPYYYRVAERLMVMFAKDLVKQLEMHIRANNQS